MRIWFNRWFSTVAHYIEFLRNNEEGTKFEIFGSHPNKDSIYLQYCDKVEIEPDIKGEEYVEYCLDFCRRNKIDIFIPRKENVNISRHIHKFNELGVKVLVYDKVDMVEMMDNKVKMYLEIEEKRKRGIELIDIPEYVVVNMVEEFKKAYETLVNKGVKVCMKPVIGEGSTGFRVIDDKADSVEYLLNNIVNQKISYDQVCKVLSKVDRFNDLMVLEYLDGDEYSIDCLADGEGNLLVSIPRKKGKGRIRVVERNEELIEIAKRISKEYKIPYVFNIQVRYGRGVPKLLEINPRMSGGLYISCLTGINIPYLAIKLLLGEKVEIPELKWNQRISYLEMPVIMNNKL